MHARENGSLSVLRVYCGDGECSGHSLSSLFNGIQGGLEKRLIKADKRKRGAKGKREAQRNTRLKIAMLKSSV